MSDDNKPKVDSFYLWYTLIEGTAMILAVAAWYFWHHNLAYLIGSLVIVALVGSTFILPKALAGRTATDTDDRSGNKND